MNLAHARNKYEVKVKKSRQKRIFMYLIFAHAHLPEMCEKYAEYLHKFKGT